MAATLGVPTLDYALWAVQCYAGLIIAGFYAITGICIAKTDAHETNGELVNEK